MVLIFESFKVTNEEVMKLKEDLELLKMKLGDSRCTNSAEIERVMSALIAYRHF